MTQINTLMTQTEKFEKIVYPELSYKISGVLFRAKEELGRARSERQYCDAIEKYLKESGIKYEREKSIITSAESTIRNRVDFLVENKIILEVKSKPFITKNDYYQTLRYLETSDKWLAILVNMRRYYIHPKRILNPKFSGYKSSSNLS